MISVLPISATVPPGGALLTQVSVTAENGFNGSVTISVTGLPTGATVSPSSPFTMTAGSQAMTLNLPANASLGSTNVILQASSGNLQHTAEIALQIQQQPFASFSVNLNNNELSFAQGGSANTIVGITQNSNGNSNYEVQFSLTGLPAGVTATFGANPFVATQPATALAFAASPTSGLANDTTITVTATRAADGVQESAQLVMNVTPPVGSLPAIRTDFVRTDGTPAAAVYDAVHGVVYASNPQWNRVDVISQTTHQIVNSIQAPDPTGMDMSLDGKQLIVTSNAQQIVAIDTTTLQVVKRTTVPPIVKGGSQFAVPDLLANTSNGTVLVGMTLDSDPPAYFLEQWNPATGTFAALSAPGVTAYIDQLVRTGDGAKVLVVDYGSQVNMAVYDAPSNSFSVSGQSPVGQVLGVAASPTAHQFAVLGTNGFAFLDSSLNTLATPSLGGIFWGMKYSPDGTKLYVVMQLSFEQCSAVAYPVVLTYDANSFSLLGISPAFQTPSGNPCTPYLQAVPLAADNTGLLYSAFNHGLVLDDGQNFQNVLNLPNGPPFPQVSFTNEAALNQPLITGLGQIAFDVLPDVRFGNNRGTNIQFSGGLVSVTAPPSATAGLVNVKAVLPDGWFSLVAQAFSYGSNILFLSGNQGATEGGATLTLIGYGLIGNSGVTPSVTIGGQPANVTAASKYNDINPSAGYLFAGVDEVQVTVPPAQTAGAVDVTITSAEGTSTLSKAFNYVRISDYSSPDTLTYALYDSQRHWVYSSAGDHIDVFSADTQQFLTAIVPPSVSGSRKILGLALTPDKSKLLAANSSDLSVAIIDPDNPSSSTAVQIPVTVANAPGVADVVATSNGKVFVDGVSGTFAGCGGQVWELDLATQAVTLRTDLPFPGLQVGGSHFSSGGGGDEVLLAGPNCGTFLWSASTDTFVASLPLVSDGSSASEDGYWFGSDYTRLDAQMLQHIQAQVPDFFDSTPGVFNTDLAGEKMNAAGSVLYTPLSNGVDVTDTNHGAWLGRVLLSEQISPLAQNAMDFDETGNRLFLITNKGLTVANLAAPPLSIAYLNPATGSASGGTSVTIRGSGFESGATVTVGGTAVTATVVDGETLQIVTPIGTVGGARVSIQNLDGTSYALDAGFTYD
jgi:hypothetical protein